MTAYEIWDQINNFVTDKETDKAVCNTLARLYYDKKEDEAIAYIENFFKCDNQTANEAFKIFKQKTGAPPSPQQIARANAVARELLNKPKCPTCSSTNVQKIGTGERAASIALFGIFSEKINKTFKCNNCGYTW